MRGTVLTMELMQATWRREMERCEPDPPIVVSPEVYAAYVKLMTPARAAKTLPNGLVIPGGSFMVPKKPVTCSKCNRLEAACTCYDVDPVAGPPAVEVQFEKTVQGMVDAYKAKTSREEQAKALLDPLTVVEGRCYMCWHPRHQTARHRGTGIRYCLPCATQHLVQET